MPYAKCFTLFARLGDSRLKSEQAQQLHASITRLLWNNWGGSVCTLIFCIVATPLDSISVALWFAAFTAYALWHRHVSAGNLPADSDLVLRRSVLTSALSGFLWGLMYGALIASGYPALQHLTLAAFAVYILGSLLQVGCHLPSFIAMIGAPSVAVIIAFAVWGEGITRHLSWIAALFSGGGIAAGMAYAEHLAKLWRLRFENLDLIAELRIQKSVAEEANQAKSRFLAAASHDLRQPLLALNLYHEALHHQINDRDTQELVEQAQQCARAMDEMFGVLLDLSQLETGALRLHPQAVAIHPLLQRLHVEFKMVAQRKELRLRIGRGNGVVHTDPDLLAIMLRNLLSNALRYTDQGGVWIGLRRRNGRLCIQVWDTGCGIAPAWQARIFEAYERGQHQGRSRHGLGLGLAIVHRLSELLSAPVTLRSREGKGSVFTVMLEKS